MASSSEPSMQSGAPSHRLELPTHAPLPQVNWFDEHPVVQWALSSGLIFPGQALPSLQEPLLLQYVHDAAFASAQS